MVNRRSRSVKKQITWKEPALKGVKHADFARDIPTHVSVPTVDTTLSQLLFVGNILYTSVPTKEDEYVYCGGKYKNLITSYWEPQTLFSKGKMVLYVGTTRVDEKTSSGKIISAVRHKFLVDGCEYIILRPDEVFQTFSEV